MTKPISAAAHAAIDAAMARLLATADDRATLTIARLASEAGLLSRTTLYRAPELLGRFQAALKQCNADCATALAVTDCIDELEAEIAMLRGRETDEMRELRAANRNMTQHIQAQAARPRAGTTNRKASA